MFNLTRKMRGGTVSNADIDKAVETANELVIQLKAIQTSAESDTYSLGDTYGLGDIPSSQPSSSSFEMSDYNSEPALETSVPSSSETSDLSSSMSVPSVSETSNVLTESSIIPLYDLSTRETVNVPLSSIISQLKTKNKQVFKRNPNNQYATALNKVNSATTVQEVQTAIKTLVSFKNGKIMGGKTQKRKITKRKSFKKTSR